MGKFDHLSLTCSGISINPPAINILKTAHDRETRLNKNSYNHRSEVCEPLLQVNHQFSSSLNSRAFLDYPCCSAMEIFVRIKWWWGRQTTTSFQKISGHWIQGAAPLTFQSLPQPCFPRWNKVGRGSVKRLIKLYGRG